MMEEIINTNEQSFFSATAQREKKNIIFQVERDKHHDHKKVRNNAGITFDEQKGRMFQPDEIF